MEERKGKRTVVSLNSSSEEEYDDEVDENDDDDEDYDDEEEADDHDEGDEENNENDDESLCNKVIRLLKENSELDSLKLKDCKSYLRKYGLRVTGTKLVCSQRIKDHWRLKDGNAEALYPSSSFAINCTGDVCKGDVVLFTQKVYERFDKVTRHGRVIGRRTIAGKVVKESYGAAKQQHTFTVEVLWSRGIKKLPLLFPLLVKGRNLYKLKTFRQRWRDEAERLKVLAEKHKRGSAARLERAMKKTKKWTANRGLSQKRKTTESKKGKDYFDRQGKTAIGGSQIYNACQDLDSTFRASKSFRGHQKFTWPSATKVPSSQSHTGPPPRTHHQSQTRSQYRSAPYPFHRHDRSSAPTIMRLPLRNYANTHVIPPPHFQCFDHSNHANHGFVNPGYNNELRNWSGSLEPDVCRPLHPFIRRSKTYDQRK